MFLTETVDEDIIICTNRGGGYGKYDIYITKLPPLIRKAIRKSVREIKKYDQGIIFRSGRIRKRTVPDKSKKTYMKEKSILTVKKKKDDKKIKDTKDTKDKKKGTSLVNKKVNKKDDNKIIKNGDTKKNNSNDDTIISKNDNNKKLNNDSSKKFDHLKDDGIKVKKNVEKTKVFVTFLDKKSKKPIDVKVYVYLKDTEDPVAEELRSVVRRTNDEGTVRIIPKYDVRFIVLKLKAYNPQFRKSIKVTWGTHSKLTVYVDKYDFTSDNSDDIVKMREKCFNYTKTGIKLCPIYFNFNSAYIRISYYPYLHTIIRYLRKNRKARITIYGHSDYYGGTFINKKLSYKRARAVRRFFLRFGISPYRIRIMGMGDKCPRTGQNELYSNYMNRRVEFKIF